MTTQNGYGHLQSRRRGARFKGTATDGTELTIQSDTTPASDVGDVFRGDTLTHGVVTADTVPVYAFIQGADGGIKGTIPVATTGAVQKLPMLQRSIPIQDGDLLRVLTDA